jgi:hypothetical protein
MSDASLDRAIFLISANLVETNFEIQNPVV